MRTSRTAALTVAVAAALGVVAVWWVFVATAPGQRVEEIALAGSEIVDWRRYAAPADNLLEVVSVPFLALATLTGVVTAGLRRRWRLAVAVPVLVGGANATTQVLKYAVLPRPDLGVGPVDENTLPSGHTTVAASVAAVAVLVAPPRWRWLAALAGWGYAGATALATLVTGSHRASDVAAALLVVLAWASLAVVAVRPSGPTRSHGSTATTTVLLVTAAAVAAAISVVGLAATVSSAGPVSDQGRAMLLLAYGGACSGIAAVTCLAAAIMLRLCTVPLAPHSPSALPDLNRRR